MPALDWSALLAIGTLVFSVFTYFLSRQHRDADSLSKITEAFATLRTSYSDVAEQYDSERTKRMDCEQEIEALSEKLRAALYRIEQLEKSETRMNALYQEMQTINRALAERVQQLENGK